MYIHYTKQLYDFLVIADRAQSNMVWNLQNKLPPLQIKMDNEERTNHTHGLILKPTSSFDELFWQQQTKSLPTLTKRQEKLFTAQHHHLAAQTNETMPSTSKAHHTLPTISAGLPLYNNAGWYLTELRALFKKEFLRRPKDRRRDKN